MPSLLTTRPEWSDQVQVPADGDLADESSLRAPFQQLANSARWLRDFILLHGVFAIRGVADLNALKAIVHPTNGQVAYVYGRGIYAFLDAPGRAEDLPWVVAPADGGSGRWVHPLANLIAGPGAFLVTNTQGKVDAARLPNAVLGIHTKTVHDYAHAAASYTDVPEWTVNVPAVQPGDLLHIDWGGTLSVNNPGPNPYAAFVPCIFDSGQDYQLNAHEVRVTHHTNSQNAHFQVGTVWTAATADVRVKGRTATLGSGGEARVMSAYVRILHVRP